MALENLTHIDWSKYSHAYGSATDVPNLIQNLTSQHKETQEEALSTLYNTIWHQGTVYEATVQAVPFLIELLTVPSVVYKDGILHLLEAIANGSSYLDVHQHLDFYHRDRKTDSFQDIILQELKWVIEAHKAVEEGIDTYLTLIKDFNAEVAAMAPYTLVACKNHAGRILPSLHVALQNEDRVPVKISLIIGFATLLTYCLEKDSSSQEEHIRYLETLSDETQESPYVRLSAAISLINIKGASAIEPALVCFAQLGAFCRLSLEVYVPWLGNYGCTDLMSEALSPYPHIHMGWLIGLLENPEFSEQKQRLHIVWRTIDVSRQSRSATRIVVPYVARLLTDKTPQIRQRARQMLPQMGQAKWLAHDSLLSLQSHTDEEIRTHATEIINAYLDLDHKIEEAINSLFRPILSECESTTSLFNQIEENLSSRQWQLRQERIAALRCIDHFGGATFEHQPLLVLLLKDEEPLVRIYAARILWNLTEDSTLVLPVLFRELVHLSAFLLNHSLSGFLALETLGRMKSSASDIIPRLKEIINSDKRWVRGGAVDTWNETDDAFAKVAKETLEKLLQ